MTNPSDYKYEDVRFVKKGCCSNYKRRGIVSQAHAPADYEWIKAFDTFSGVKSAYRIRSHQIAASNNNAPIDAMFWYSDGEWATARAHLVSMGPQFYHFVLTNFPQLLCDGCGLPKTACNCKGVA